MSFHVMWLGSLLAAILVVALAASAAARAGKRWLCALVAGAVSCGALYAGVVMCLWTFALRPFVPFWFTAATAWSIACSVSVLNILWRGAVRKNSDGGPGAAGWPLKKILVGLAGVLLVTGVFARSAYVRLSAADDAARARLVLVLDEASATLLKLAPPAAPAERNAAPIYGRAFEILRTLDEPDWLYESRNPDFASAPAKQLLNGIAPAAELLRRAAARNACRFDVDYSKPPCSVPSRVMERLFTAGATGDGAATRRWDALLKDLRGGRSPGEFTHAARMLSAESRARSQAGGAGALESAAAIWRLAEHVALDAETSCVLAAMKVESYAPGPLEAALAKSPPGPEDLARVRACCYFAYDEVVRRHLRWTEAAYEWQLASLGLCEARAAVLKCERMLGGKLVPRDSLLMMIWRVHVFPEMLAAHRSATAKLKSLAAGPFHEARSEWAAVAESGLNSAERAALRAGGPPRWILSFACSADARRRVGALGVIVAAYRQDKGAYPEELEDLKEAGYIRTVPVDPCSGRPLRMATTEDGVIIYSVGLNGVDDGGEEMIRADEGDITFCLGSAYRERRLDPPGK